MDSSDPALVPLSAFYQAILRALDPTWSILGYNYHGPVSQAVDLPHILRCWFSIQGFFTACTFPSWAQDQSFGTLECPLYQSTLFAPKSSVNTDNAPKPLDLLD